MENILKAQKGDFDAIHEIGTVMAQSLADFSAKHQPENFAEIKEGGVNMSEPHQRIISDKLAGKKFIFTGELSKFTRSQASSLVRKLGGEIVSSVSKNTDFVVAGGNPGSKYDKAQSLNIPIIDEKQFEEMTHD